MKALLILLLTFVASFASAQSPQEPAVRVGSKIFTESYILAEAMAQLLEHKGFKVERKLGLGGTLVAFEALKNNQIDVYPEYTGTISEVILKAEVENNFEALNKALNKQDVALLPSFGFNNSYAIVVSEELAKEKNLKTLSDVQGMKLRAAFPHEFYSRKDGWLNLKDAYDLPFIVKPVEHSLMFEAIKAKDTDVIVAYGTDGKIEKMNLSLLEDDKGFFPQYFALPIIHSDLSPKAQQVLRLLSDSLDEASMRRLNSLVEEQELSFQQAATLYLQDIDLLPGETSLNSPINQTQRWKLIFQRIGKLTLEHLYLVLISTFCATLVAIPLGLLLFRFKKFAPSVLSIVGLLQTIPSLALLVYMIPWLGVTVEAALMALFLYSLLPILQNTYSGLQSVDPNLIQAAQGIGLYRREILFTVQLPLALPIIMAGIRVAMVINVGTATIAAFIGSGGLGELIVQGLSLNNINLMQQGAVPAALLAIGMNIFFSYIEKKLA